MMKMLDILFFSFFMALSLMSSAVEAKSASDYTKTLSSSERESICNEIRSATFKQAEELKSAGGGVIPDSVMQSLYKTTQNISDTASMVLVVGHALMCHATRTLRIHVTIGGIEITTFPHIPVWLCGLVVYFMGFMITLSIVFYLVDIAFKLGFAIILLPIGIALWPFPPTKNKLSMLISVFLKNAAIFIFLALTVSYTLNLLITAMGDLATVLENVDNEQNDSLAENFSFSGKTFLLIVFALAYGMKLIGSAVADYADKFFPDNAFGKGQSASPIHGSMTQAMDFAKKEVVTPVASFAHDVAKTQMGRATVAVGNKVAGDGKGARGFMGGMMVAVGTKMQQNKKTPKQKEEEKRRKAKQQAKGEEDQEKLMNEEAEENARRAEQNNME